MRRVRTHTVTAGHNDASGKLQASARLGVRGWPAQCPDRDAIAARQQLPGTGDAGRIGVVSGDGEGFLLVAGGVFGSVRITELECGSH
jgi:hypothetical protein